MLHKRLILNAVLMLGLGLTGLKAQESINATGGDASGSGGSASYSVGQVTYTTDTANSGSLAHGVQQPYEISEVTGVEEAKGISLSATAYPNPTTDYIILSIDESTIKSWQSMRYELLDINGKLLQSENISGFQTNLATGNLVASTYFVKVMQDDKEVKTFKIIKNK